MNTAQKMADSIVPATTRNGKKFRNQKNQILAFIAGSSSFVSTSAIAKAVGASLTTVGARVSELRSDFGVNFKTVDVNVNGSNQTAYSL
jgi:biotin operon repressor|tara:strand:- start:86 stop:352 length:267 start_codon:yes stop_codon:yes gene_type:complete